ncbi:hypothetical protein AAFC00_002390 [Neodothiora populina]|uniref:Uncharacterized protein n=1 Tax=Neodothiora populina TaxID=2781224 RepID=A0ABR3P732_9PEZI
MPSRNRGAAAAAAAAAWLLRGTPVLAQPDRCAFQCDSDSHALVDLLVKYNKSSSQGMVNLRTQLHLQGFDAIQSLSLVLRPENIVTMALEPHNTVLSPDKMKSIFTDALPAGDQVSTLSISLRSPGGVLCPMSSSTLFPKPVHESRLRAFTKLCASTSISIYFGSNHISEGERQDLHNFINSIQNSALTSCPIDLRRLQGGKGAQEVDWRLLGLADAATPSPEAPPPYWQQSQSQPERKRLREACSSSPSPEKRPVKKILQHTPSLGSPTEPNTPSIRGSLERDENSRASTKASASPCSDAHTINTPNLSSLLRNIIRSELRDLVDTTLPDTVRAVIKEELLSHNLLQTETVYKAIDIQLGDRLKPLVEENLPPLIMPAIEAALDGVFQTVEDEQAIAHVDLQETVEDARLELVQARDDGIHAIEATAQENLDDFTAEVEAVSESYFASIEEKHRECLDAREKCRLFHKQCRKLSKERESAACQWHDPSVSTRAQSI